MKIPVHLGLDIGGTASRWVICNGAGEEQARGKAGGATGHMFNPAENQRLREALGVVAGAIDTARFDIVSVTLGLTGFGAPVSAQVKDIVENSFGVGPQSIIVIDDVALAYLANFAPGEGHLVSAGTGSIGIHIAANGDFTRVGGRGILIDDAGSGSWIALRAIDRIYRVLDHSGSFDDVNALAECLFKEIGGGDWGDVRQFIYAGDRGKIGALAVGVAAAAEAGDRVALEILRAAGAELAQLVTALSARVGERPAGFIGGVLALHPVIETEIRRHHAGSTVRVLKGDAALAAARLRGPDPHAWLDTLTAMGSA